MFTVYFKTTTYNQHRSYPRNYNRFISSRSFPTEAEAMEFAKTVNVESIYNPAGHKVGR